MPLFVLSCTDKADSLDLRMATREAHLAYVRERLSLVKLAGPYLTADGGMKGSLLVLDVEDEAAARAFRDNDPYFKAGLFQRIELTSFKVSIGSLG